MSRTKVNKAKLKKQLITHEARRLFAYDDATGQELRPGDKLIGNLTIGVGRNLTGNGLSDNEVDLLLESDICAVISALESRLSVWDDLDECRQRALADMAFNMGVSGLLKFKRMLACIDSQDWKGAYAEALSSVWAKQVGARARTIAEMILTGEG